jgi:uncharacterized membrane protein
MKASPIMFFAYIGMIGVPVLLLVLAAAALFQAPPVFSTILLALIAAGCVVYGAIGIREVFVHGRRPGGVQGSGSAGADKNVEAPSASGEARQ